ncbi:ethylbenzene dehydrogenase-related protein [Ferruginivarius sediminum]|nr:ethylbenzene dehydrogenase-related protein [Ferruginivarius sediminum]
MKRNRIVQTLLLGSMGVGFFASGVVAGPAMAASPADWTQIPARTVTLFYPGQSSYQWLRSRAHPGARMVWNGAACLNCHSGTERGRGRHMDGGMRRGMRQGMRWRPPTAAKMGRDIVDGGPLEPTPIPGKNGVLNLSVQAAYDAENLYLRFQWRTNLDRPGRMHNYMRFDGEKWAFYGGPRSSESVASGEEPPLYEDRLAIMIDDGSVPGFRTQGCWLTCHRGMRDMPGEATKAEVKAHPLIGETGLGRSDVRKYLPDSRTDAAASWDKTKSAQAIADIKGAGGFVDLMQWRAHRSNPIEMADDGYVLEYRLSDEGKGPYGWNVDRETMTPKYMFDPDKVGMKVLTVDDIGDPAKPYALIREENAVPYDADADWEEGDVLPGRLLSRVDATGSASDNSRVHGEWDDGVWTVEWTRKLDTGHSGDDKILREGRTYTFGFAVHDDNVTTRFHFVSFPIQFGIGSPGQIQATRLR